MAQQAQQVNISQLPPASLLYNGDVFAVDQIGGDGYTKQVSFQTLYRSISSIILPDLYATKVSIAGSTMTGALILSGAPAVALQAATKQYVDDAVVFTLSSVQSRYVALTGSTMTGALTLSGNPTQNLHAATKQYVDTLFSSISGSNLTPLVPAGTIIWYAGNAAPAGYLVCNGDVISDTIPSTVQGVTADFSALRTVIGSTYGGAGVLPDMRGLFARGWDAAGGISKNIDASRTFGSVQNASLIGFDEKNDAVWNTSTLDDDPVNSSAALSLDLLTQDVLIADYAPDGDAAEARVRLKGASQANSLNPFTTGPTTTEGWVGGARPRNIALLPCIKY
jgi:microcystin-dependent protein